MTAASIIDRLRFDLGNIGIAIVATQAGEGDTVLLVEGTNNKRRASYGIPGGVLPDADEAALIETAIEDIKRQIASNSGFWPSGD